MKKLALAGILGLGVAVSAMAGTASDDFTVTATVDPYCEVTTPAGDVSVTYNPYDATATQDSTTVGFNCVAGTNYSISVITDGTLEGSADPANTLSFTATPSVTSGTDSDGMAGEESVDIAIVIPAGQDVPVDTYSDTVTVEISY
ncbi:spore coat protein U domain-containing protein [Persephonella sp.]